MTNFVLINLIDIKNNEPAFSAGSQLVEKALFYNFIIN